MPNSKTDQAERRGFNAPVNKDSSTANRVVISRSSRHISPISKRRAVELAEYAKAKREWWKNIVDGWEPTRIPLCVRIGCFNRAEKTPHHSRGRAGSLLCDTRFWIALCRKCHAWVHNNPDAARQAGLLCEKGLWNTPVKL